MGEAVNRLSGLARAVAVAYAGNLMIYPYDNSTQTRWDRGEFKVQLNLPNNPRPMGFCDGSPEDVAELLSIAEAEGADDVKIHKKHLKSGREVWTLGGKPAPCDEGLRSDENNSPRFDDLDRGIRHFENVHAELFTALPFSTDPDACHPGSLHPRLKK